MKSQPQFLHVLRNAKPQARRALITSVNDGLLKAIIECAIDTLNGNYKLTKDEESKLQIYKKWLCALLNPKIIFNIKRNLLIQEGGFIVSLLITVLSGVIGALINIIIKNGIAMYDFSSSGHWQNYSQAPPPPPIPVKKILNSKKS